MSSFIVARDLSYHLPNGRELFDDLNFTLDRGVTALVGANGVGKTVLAGLIAGDLLATRGRVRSESTVRLFRQREQPDDITVEEYLAMWHETPLEGTRLLQGIDRRASCLALSGGLWMRVRLARALGDGFLVLDEPTSDLDCASRETLAQIMRLHRGGALIISHDRELLTLCSRVLELSNRGLTSYGDGWQSYLDARVAEEDRLTYALVTAKSDRDRLSVRDAEQRARQDKQNRRGSAAAGRGGMPGILLGARKRRAQQTTGKREAAAIGRAYTAVRDVHAALTEIKNDATMYTDVEGCEIPAQKLVAEAHGFNVRFGDWLYLEDLTFTWRGNVRLALRGDNGSGKSTLLRAVLGATVETRGTWRRGDFDTLYLDQQLGSLDPEMTVLECVGANARLSDSGLRTGLSRFLFAGDAVFERVGNLSGGERLRAALARAFLAQRRPQLMLLDEPTNSLDIRNAECLATVVSQFRGAVIVASHDENFLKDCQLTHHLLVRSSTRAGIDPIM